MGWGLRGKVSRALEHAAEVVALERAAIALCAMRRHQAEFGRYPNLVRPKTFNEKVLYRMAFDRRPVLITVQDKYAAREYVRQRVGGHVLTQLYCVTKDPANIPFDRLPTSFVVKATHGCGFNYLVPDKARVDWADLMAKCALWLKSNYYYDSGNREWVYKHIEPRIIVEEFINDGTGPTPIDYKFYVFGGRVHLIWAMTGRFVDPRSDPYTPSWDRPSMKGRWKPVLAPLPRPPHLEEMIHCAEILGADLDFIRVDLYDANKVYFGEMTSYPSGGCDLSDPKWNLHLGELWNLSLRDQKHPNVGTISAEHQKKTTAKDDCEP